MFDFDWDLRFRVNLWFLIWIFKSGVCVFDSFLFFNVHGVLHEENEDWNKGDEGSIKNC